LESDNMASVRFVPWAALCVLLLSGCCAGCVPELGRFVQVAESPPCHRLLNTRTLCCAHIVELPDGKMFLPSARHQHGAPEGQAAAERW